MSAFWVKCENCGYKFDIDDSIQADFKCPACGSKYYEIDKEIEKFDEYYSGRNDDDYEGYKS